ncbi:MAG: preprotein translocase subunit SecG [Cyclobacteriaceae bacterium]|jgi:preprotein translocase subunit SecG
MYSLLIGLGIFAAVLLVFVVLAQNSKGGGLSSQFGGSGASNIMGVKKTGDLLERLTWIFIVVIILVSLGTNVVSPNQQSNDDILERVRDQKPALPSALPSAPAADSIK